MKLHNSIVTLMLEAQRTLISLGMETAEEMAKTSYDKEVIMSPGLRRRTENLSSPIIDYLEKIARQYRGDPDSLLKLYEKDPLWKLAIRKMVAMDDEDEGAFWFYHAYQNVPNSLFRLYIAEHPIIGLERVLEMYECGYGKDFIDLKLDLKNTLGKNLDDCMSEIFFILDERLARQQMLVHEKEVAQFIALLYNLNYKKVDVFLEEYEISDDGGVLSFAQSCREAIQFMIENNPAQRKLVLA